MYFYYCPRCGCFWNTNERPKHPTTWYGRPGYGGWRVCPQCRHGEAGE